MNHDPPTSLANTESSKLLKLKALADNTPDDLSTEDRIIRNPVPGTCMILPAKRVPPKSPFKQQPKQPRLNFTIETVNPNPDTNPTTMEQAMKRP